MDECRRIAVTVSLALLAALAAAPALAQLPAGKPLRLVSPFPPGGSVDVIARLVGARIQESYGQPVVIDNRSGGNGIVGTEAVLRAAPDGLTVLIQTLPFVTAPPMVGKVPYDPIKDFAPISLLAQAPAMLVVHPSLPVKNLKDLIALARARPGQLSYSSAGSGSNLHFPAVELASLAKIDLLHVPYKGGGPALTAVLGGEVAMSFISLVAVLPHVQAGKLRPIAVTGVKRAPGAPNVPTVAESGLPDFEFQAWFAALAPAGTPPATIAALHQLLTRAIQAPELRERLAAEGVEVIAGAPEALSAHLRNESARWTRVIRDHKLKSE